ncbi:MAG: 2TM domain-containing protein [Candidatus Odinarchaeota archaeon]
MSSKTRVKTVGGFYIHLFVYIMVNILLFAIWFFITLGFPWFIFPLLGWGIGVVAHGLAVFFVWSDTD